MKKESLFPLYMGTLLVSMATLTFQVGLTRIFAIAQWYHFAFMIVSLALLGFGASGSFLSAFPQILNRNLHNLTASCAAMFSITAILSFFILNNLPFDSFKITIEPIQILYFAIYYVSLAVPFFFAGMIIAIFISEFPAKVNFFYCFSLAGSGLGAALVPGIAGFAEGAKITIVVALMCILAGGFFLLPRSRKASYSFLILCILVIAILFRIPNLFEIRLSPYKSLSLGLRFKGAELLRTKWNPYSRVDVVRSRMIKFAPGLSITYPGTLPQQIGMTIDGENPSAITKFDGEIRKLAFINYLPTTLAYKLKKDPDVLVINPRGGLDILTALFHGADSVNAVEDNPLTVRMLKEEFKEFAGEIYNLPNVAVAAEGPRSYIEKRQDRFDIIDIALTDSYSIVATGAFSLSENYLYTKEAIRSFLNRLQEDGLLSITRWLQIPPSESSKLAATIIAALERRGIAHPENHIAAIRTWMSATYLVKRTPFTEEELKTIRAFSRKMRFDLVYLPGISEDEVNKYNVLDRAYYYEVMHKLLDPKLRQSFLREYTYDISAVTDNRPFFFHFFKWKQVPHALKNLGKQWLPFGGGGYLVMILLLAIALASSLLFILLPVCLKRREKLFTLKRWRILAYFFCLGIGFLFIEIPMMHQFILFLDHPIYSFSIVIGAVLVFSGLGSFASRKLKSRRSFGFLVILLAFWAIGYLFILPELFKLYLGTSFALRILITTVCLFPISCLMGIPFPTGIRLVSQIQPELIPWAWCANGCASVLSAILSAMIALSWGYSAVLVSAGIVYLLALVVIFPLMGSALAGPPKKWGQK